MMSTRQENLGSSCDSQGRLLLTIAIGNNALWAHSHPLMKEYARKIGADFLVLNQADYGSQHPKLTKLAIHSLLDRYPRILYVDGDVGINPQCPDLFRIVRNAELGAVCEKLPYYDRTAVMRKACEYYGVRYSHHHEFFNTGMMVVSRQQKEMFAGEAKEKIRGIGGFLDQAYLNVMALKHNIQIRDLGFRFNYFGSLVNKRNKPRRPEEAYIFHATRACGDPLGHLERTVTKWRQAGHHEGTGRRACDGTVWVGGFATCSCTDRCGHAGMRSYVACYQTVLDYVRPKLVYEWGPGENSRMAVEAGAQVIAVEQDIRFVPRDLGHRFRALVVDVTAPSYPIPLVRDADVYFIDSRRRAECTSAIWRECVREGHAPNTVVALHDAQRSRYHEALRLFPYVNFLDRGFCVASCRNDVLTFSAPARSC